MRACMHQPSHSIGEEHVYLLRFDDRCYFTQTKIRMDDCLAGTICTRLLIGRAWRCVRATTSELGTAFEGTKLPALGAIDARNEAALGD